MMTASELLPDFERTIRTMVREGFGVDDMRVKAGASAVSVWATLEGQFGRDHPWTRMARRRCGVRL